MDGVEDYARKWAKRKEVELDTLSEWIKSVRHLIQVRISKLSKTMSVKNKSVFLDPALYKVNLELIHKLKSYGITCRFSNRINSWLSDTPCPTPQLGFPLCGARGFYSEAGNAVAL